MNEFLTYEEFSRLNANEIAVISAKNRSIDENKGAVETCLFVYLDYVNLFLGFDNELIEKIMNAINYGRSTDLEVTAFLNYIDDVKRASVELKEKLDQDNKQ